MLVPALLLLLLLLWSLLQITATCIAIYAAQLDSTNICHFIISDAFARNRPFDGLASIVFGSGFVNGSQMPPSTVP